MIARSHVRSWGSRLVFSCSTLLLVGIVSCVPASTGPSPVTSTVAPLPTATSEVIVPSGWETYTRQSCEYSISHPPEMQVTNEGLFSQIIGFKIADPDAGARNFIYVSVIPKDLQGGTGEDVGVYNADPAVIAILLNMQVGESKQVHGPPDVAPFYTYTRNPDVTLAGHTAMKFENAQPWEFPPGTKEIRYYLPVEDCSYLIGGYMDTTGSNLPGAITEDLFNQVLSTFRVIP